MSDTKSVTRKQMEAILGELSPADRKILEAHMKGSKARRADEATLISKYPHIVEGSLRFNDTKNKQEVDITCVETGCGKTRTVFTSDLFQVDRCTEHKKLQAKARKEERDARVKAILEKAGEIKV